MKVLNFRFKDDEVFKQLKIIKAKYDAKTWEDLMKIFVKIFEGLDGEAS